MNLKKIEILQNIESDYMPYIGKSIATLAKFLQERLPISNGFVVNSLAYSEFLAESGLSEHLQNSDASVGKIQTFFANCKYPSGLTNELERAYSKISGFTTAYVNIRALIINSKGEEIAHRTYVALDIREVTNIAKSILSLYELILQENIELIEKLLSGELQIVVLVQKAQQSEASGIMFTTDIIEKNPNKLTIEAIYGLESIIETERLIPDQYIYDKSLNEITEKHISSQEFMAVRQVTTGKSQVQKVKISLTWQKRQKLDDKHILALASTGMIIEEGIGVPQQIVWSYEGGKLWINFIESTDKLVLSSTVSPSLQELVDEEFINSDLPAMMDSTKLVKEENKIDKESLIDFLIAKEAQSIKEQASPAPVAPTISPQQTDLANSNQEVNFIKKMNTKISNTNEALIQGKYFAGAQSEGEVCLEVSKAKANSILVLSGNEDIQTDLKVAGFIIEDESEVLAIRLNEFFNVPVITGVPLARKILKPSELIRLNGSTGEIFETIPFSEQVGELEINLDSPVLALETEEVITNAPTQNENDELDMLLGKSAPTPQLPEITAVEIEVPENTEVSIEVSPEPEAEVDEQELSKILDLVSYDTEIASIEEEKFNQDEVTGMNTDVQFDTWGKSLENIISASKSVNSTAAVEAFESVIDEHMELTNSKESAFGNEQDYIATNIHQEEEGISLKAVFIPTATKVYVHLIDEDLPSEFKNFDGLIFSSSYDMDVYCELLANVLEKSEGKDVIAICPPYETEALQNFLENIHSLRNSHRNLSIILPDYRNKSEIIEVKKTLSSIGLRRSSTFTTLANVSRTINLFRLKELDTTLVDGVYFDLFRVKMNMLGVEKLKASTRYSLGMQNMVEYINDNLPFEGKSIIDLTGFNTQKSAIRHLMKHKFYAIGASLAHGNNVKKLVSSLEKKHISLKKPVRSQKRVGLKTHR